MRRSCRMVIKPLMPKPVTASYSPLNERSKSAETFIATHGTQGCSTIKLLGAPIGDKLF